MAPIKELTVPKTFILSLPFPEIHGRAPWTNHQRWGVEEGWEGVDPWDALHCTIRRTSRAFEYAPRVPLAIPAITLYQPYCTTVESSSEVL